MTHHLPLYREQPVSWKSVMLCLSHLFPLCRKELRFWNSVVLGFTLCLAAAQVFPIAINAYFQLTIMLMVLLVDFAALTYLRPFEDDLMQGMQVSSL